MINRYWHAQPTPDTGIMDISDIEYVGVTDLSVEVHLRNGERIRITSNEFLAGLKIESSHLTSVVN